MKFKTTSMIIAGAAILATTGLGGCATKKYVGQQVGGLEARHGPRLDGLDKTSSEALARATAAGKLAEGKFDYAVTLSDDSVKFQSGEAVLAPEAVGRLAELVSRLKTDNRNVYLEIQGHTDATGSPNGNIRLGEQRAEAVRRYLSEQGVALNRMATISYGEDQPAAANNTREGRLANRRVVIVVLS